MWKSLSTVNANGRQAGGESWPVNSRRPEKNISGEEEILRRDTGGWLAAQSGGKLISSCLPRGRNNPRRKTIFITPLVDVTSSPTFPALLASLPDRASGALSTTSRRWCWNWKQNENRPPPPGRQPYVCRCLSCMRRLASNSKRRRRSRRRRGRGY